MMENTVGLKNNRNKSILAFLLGISTSLYVTYIAKIGNIPLRLDVFVPSLIFLILLITKNKNFNLLTLRKYFNKYILLFGVAIIISGINLLIYSSKLGNQDIFLKATLVVYLIPLLAYIVTIMLKEYKLKIINGMIVGLFINILFSLIQYVTWEIGSYFTLYTYFPQPSFYVPIYNFRTMGFFLEPSHMMQYIISTFLLFEVTLKKGIKKSIINIFLLLTILLSKSGNVLVLTVILFIFFLKKKRNKILLRYSYILTSLFILILLILNIDKLIEIKSFLNIDLLLRTIFLNDRTGTDRLIGMKTGMQYISEYPLGIGYGMSKTLYDLYGVAQSSYNYLLTVQLELGIFGTIVYLLRVLVTSGYLIFKGKSNYQLAIGLSIFGSELAAILNGGYFGNALWILYGLASIELYQNKKPNVREASD
jgi:hypothetical protein